MISSARHRAGGGSRRRSLLFGTVTTAVAVTFLVLIVTAPISAPFTCCMAQSTTQTFQPVMVPTLTEAEFVQHVQPSTHIMLIALVHEHTLQELQFSEHHIFINRWQQHHGRAFYVFCGQAQAQAQSTTSSSNHQHSKSNSFCRTLLDTVVDTTERDDDDGENNRKHGGYSLQLNPNPAIPTYLRWDGAGVLEIYQGIGSLQGLYEWSIRLPGGSDFIRNHPDYSFGGIIPSGRESGSGVLSPQQDADEIVVFKQFIVDAPEDAIFVEYGTGGSTHTAAVTMHGTQIWHSIEQNHVWVEQVRAGMPPTTSATAQTQVHVHHIQPSIPYRGHPEQEHLEVRVIGHYREEIAMGMEEFIFADQVQPPIDWAKVHLVFVDGLARGATLVTITDRVPPGTTVLLHDYVGRQSWYDWAIRSGQYQRMQLVNSMLVLKTTVKKTQDISHNSDTCNSNSNSNHPLPIDDVHNPLSIDEFNHWSFDDLQGYWMWYKNSALVQREATYQIPINSPYSHQPFHNFRQNNSTKVIFYGSSHIRELYFSLIRLERGLRFDDTLEEVVMKVGSGPSTGIPNQSICDKDKTGYIDRLYGVNIQGCGFPGKRLVPELGPNVAIGFKTFLHTPDAEKEFIQFLELSSLTDPDVVVVDIGLWGVQGKKLGDSNATNFVMDNKMDELDYYLNWVCTAFSSSSFILFIYETDDSMLKPLMEVVEKKNNYFLWRKDRLLKSRPSAMPCAHGCRGPLMEVMAKQFLEFLRLMLL